MNKHSIKYTDNFLAELQEKYSEIWDLSIDRKLTLEMEDHEAKLIAILQTESPFKKNRLELINAERDQRYFGGSDTSIKEDIKKYKNLISDIDGTFWLEKRKSYLENIRINKRSDQVSIQTPNNVAIHEYDTALRRNLQESWRKDYETLEADWELTEIEQYRNAIIFEYSKWLDKIREISNCLIAIGLNSGLLWDLSIRELSEQDISQLLRWAEYLKNNEEIKRLCDLMGKMNSESYSHKTVKTMTTYAYEVPRSDINSREEITGIKLGNDIENLVPQEFLYLADSDLSILFDLKFTENRLMCFEKQGLQMIRIDETKEIETSIDVLDEKGPIIVCVDTSGSMSGTPESVAKAVTLLLATQAVNQKRACYLINFSTTIETIDFQPPKGIKELISFLQKSFHGGTDITPALDEAIRTMESEDYKKADILVISDFVLAINDGQLRSRIIKQRKNDNRFYALSIGQFRLESIDDIFDSQWIYDSKKGSISQLNNVIDWVTHRN